MTTQIFVSQINGTQANGQSASAGSIITFGSNGAYWANSSTYTAVGFQGSAGFQGSQGDTGYVGSVGLLGFPGDTGFQGSMGDVGYQGSVGVTSIGYQGSIGDIGFQGSVGYMGSTGVAIGYNGSVGYLGSAGFRGSQGSTGYTGSAGTVAFTTLIDAPSSYTGHAGNFLRVNAAATGIVFDSNTYITNNMVTDVNFNSNTIYVPVFQGYGENVNNLANRSISTTVSLSLGNIVNITLTASIVPIVMDTTGLVSGKLYSYTFFVAQDPYGSRTIDWSNQTIYWPTSENVPSTGPTLSTTGGYVDIINLYTIDGGATWFGMLAAKGFAGI